MACPNRPADPSKIKFTADCFEVVGTREYYLVSRSALHSGPARFYDREAAEKFARVRNQSVTVCEEQILKRIKWF